MKTVTYREKVYDRLENETILATLLRHQIELSYSCRIGVCQSCLLKSSSKDKIPERAQHGLSKKLIQQNYFLPCVCKPSQNFEIIEGSAHEIFLDSIVVEKNWLSKDVCQIILQKPNELDFHPGQFINIRNKNSLTRSYSIANSPSSNTIELHIKHLQNGKMSSWLCDELKTGETIELQGANGESYYDVTSKNQKIMLIGTGTGLSPLLGIVRDALAKKHQGEIHVYHGSRYCDGLYNIELMSELQNNNANMHYYPCISSSNTLLNNTKKIPNCINHRADEFALQNHKSLQDWKVYLCGHPDMVKKVKAKAYMAGAALKDIHIDPFELKDLRHNRR